MFFHQKYLDRNDSLQEITYNKNNYKIIISVLLF